MVMKETLKLNEEESTSLNSDFDSCKAVQKCLSFSTILDSEKNDILDDAHQELMDMNCQDRFDTEYKRAELKVKLSAIDENECNFIDYGNLKNA